jgi:hypothetical protein
MRGVKTKNIINMPTVAELKARIRVHNRRNCIRLSQRKAALANDLARVKKGTGAGAGAGAAGAGAAGAAGAGAAGAGMQQKAGKKKKRITPVLVSANVQPGGSAGFGNVGGGGGSSSSSSSSSGSGGGGGNSVGQKNFKKKLKKQKKAYKKLKGMDANPELAF